MLGSLIIDIVPKRGTIFIYFTKRKEKFCDENRNQSIRMKIENSALIITLPVSPVGENSNFAEKTMPLDPRQRSLPAIDIYLYLLIPKPCGERR